MTEIEKIIKDSWKPQFKPIDQCDFSSVAKAIEQYVIKARIEELESIDADSVSKWGLCKRISQLKKGVK